RRSPAPGVERHAGAGVSAPPLRAVLAAIDDPAGLRGLSAAEWNELLLIAREQGLAARVRYALAERGLIDSVPSKARDHLDAAGIAAESTQTAVRFEVNRMLRAVGDPGMPIVLLKGAAYLIAGLPPARGRMVGDLDLMVPKARIVEMEQALVAAG